MSSDKIYMNVESDFTLLLNLPEGYDGDFRFVVATDGRNSLKASRIGGVLEGCEQKDGQLYMVVRHGSLQPGRLRTKTYLWIDNEWVEDLQQMVPAGEDIILTAGMKNTEAAEMRVDVLAPYVKGDKGEPLRYEDLTEEQKAELTKYKADTAHLEVKNSEVNLTVGGVTTAYSIKQMSMLTLALGELFRAGVSITLSCFGKQGMVTSYTGMVVNGVVAQNTRVIFVGIHPGGANWEVTEFDAAESISNKVQKRTETDGLMRVYYADGKGGQNAMRATTVADAGHITLMTRSADGRTSVGTPTADMNATNKKYVDDADNALSERVASLEGRKPAKTKQMPWGLNDKVIVNKTIPLNARPGSKYFFEHWMTFRCYDPVTLEKVGEEGAWKCSSEESQVAVSNAVLVTIPKEFATECKSFYENNDREAIDAWLREKKCVRDCTENPYTGATTSPDFVVQSNRIICVKKIDLRPLLDYKGQDERKPALPSMIKDIISTKVEFTRRRVVPEWASNLPAKPEGKDSVMYRNKHVIRKGWENNPFEVIPLGRHGKRSIFSEKLIMSKYNNGHDERDNYFRFRKA